MGTTERWDKIPVKDRLDIKFIVVDLFAGAGGVTTGIERAKLNDKKIAKVIVAVNHDRKAIESHEANHPDAKHFIEDVRTLSMAKLLPYIEAAKLYFPNAKLVLWASAECTNFSNAKGGPKDAGSRTLPAALFRYIATIDPRYIMVENVREFKDWGPTDTNGNPIKSLKGITFDWWKNRISSMGYIYNEDISDAADYGAYTSRKRYFGAFVRPGEPFAYPDETHSKTQKDGLKPYKKVRDILDLDKYGKPIFKSIRSDNTYRRIYDGLQKHANQKAFMVQYNGQSTCQPIDKPCGTLTTKDRFSLINIQFFDQQYGNSKPTSINKPSPTLTATPKLNLITAQFLYNPQWGGHTWDINRPCFTLIARMDKAPPSIISCLAGLGPKLESTDGEWERKVKVFMRDNGIQMIYTRMLDIPEMLKIMGFGEDYILKGGITDQKRFIGNAVVCEYPEQWFSKLAELTELTAA